MKWICLSSALFWWPMLMVSTLGEENLDKNAQPVLIGADPHVTLIQGKWWIFPTYWKDRPGFYAFSSEDWTKWEEHGPLFLLEEVPWVAEDGRKSWGAWAPCIIEKEGVFYFYYSVGPQTPSHPSRIGVASSVSPLGPYQDLGKPLLTGGNGFEAIDPMVFRDPESGSHYLYAGGSDGSKLRIFILSEGMMSIEKEIDAETPPHFKEAPFMHYHSGEYHLTYSSGSYRHSNYSIHHAKSKSAHGPWEYQGIILSSPAEGKGNKGPGHHSVVYDETHQEWLLIYHAWVNQEGPGPYSGKRKILIHRFKNAPW